MNAKSLLIFLAVAGAVVWYVTKDASAPAPPPESLTAPQQRQMEKAKDIGKEMQQAADQRLQDSDH